MARKRNIQDKEKVVSTEPTVKQVKIDLGLYFKDKKFLKLYLIIALVSSIIGFVILDPDLGIVSSLTYGTLIINVAYFLLYGVVSACLLWLTAAAFTDWKDYGNLEKLGEKAMESPEGAALFSIGIQLRWIALALVIGLGFLSFK